MYARVARFDGGEGDGLRRSADEINAVEQYEVAVDIRL
jgi:hypothetical protein